MLDALGEIEPRLSESYGAYGLVDPSETFQYVLITNASIRDAATTPNVHDLVDHRRSFGMSATIVVVEDIYANYSGRDSAENAEEMANFIFKTKYIV